MGAKGSGCMRVSWLGCQLGWSMRHIALGSPLWFQPQALARESIVHLWQGRLRINKKA